MEMAMDIGIFFYAVDDDDDDKNDDNWMMIIGLINSYYDHNLILL